MNRAYINVSSLLSIPASPVASRTSSLLLRNNTIAVLVILSIYLYVSFTAVVVTAVASAKPEDAGGCPKGWTPGFASCYMFYQYKFNWMQANRTCVDMGAVLVDIKSDEENQFVFKLIESWEESWGPWIGLSRKDKQQPWTWTDGTVPIYSNWKPGEPKETPPGGLPEYCCHIFPAGGSAPGKWNDKRCFTKLPSVCRAQVPDKPIVTLTKKPRNDKTNINQSKNLYTLHFNVLHRGTSPLAQWRVTHDLGNVHGHSEVTARVNDDENMSHSFDIEAVEGQESRVRIQARNRLGWSAESDNITIPAAVVTPSTMKDEV